MCETKYYKRVLKKISGNKFAFRYFQRFWWELDTVGAEIICYEPSYVNGFRKGELHSRVVILDRRGENRRGLMRLNHMWEKFIRDRIGSESLKPPALVIGIETKSGFLSSTELERLPLLKFLFSRGDIKMLPGYNDWVYQGFKEDEIKTAFLLAFTTYFCK